MLCRLEPRLSVGLGLRKPLAFTLYTHQLSFCSYNRQDFPPQASDPGAAELKGGPRLPLIELRLFSFWFLWNLTAPDDPFSRAASPSPYSEILVGSGLSVLMLERRHFLHCMPYPNLWNAECELVVGAWNASWIQLEDSVQVKIPSYPLRRELSFQEKEQVPGHTEMHRQELSCWLFPLYFYLRVSTFS